MTVEMNSLEQIQEMIKKEYVVEGRPNTVLSWQANAIVERVHQTIGNMARIFKPENYYLDDDAPVKGILSATDFAVRATIHTTLKK